MLSPCPNMSLSHLVIELQPSKEHGHSSGESGYIGTCVLHTVLAKAISEAAMGLQASEGHTYNTYIFVRMHCFVQ